MQHSIWGVQSNHCYFLFKSNRKTLLSEMAQANLRKWLTCLYASLAKEQFSLQAISPYICTLPKIPSLSTHWQTSMEKGVLECRSKVVFLILCLICGEGKRYMQKLKVLWKFPKRKSSGLASAVLPLLHFVQHRSMDSLPAVIPCSHYFTGE